VVGSDAGKFAPRHQHLLHLDGLRNKNVIEPGERPHRAEGEQRPVSLPRRLNIAQSRRRKAVRFAAGREIEVAAQQDDFLVDDFSNPLGSQQHLHLQQSLVTPEAQVRGENIYRQTVDMHAYPQR
jgi:hypothetical protein